MEDEQEQTGEAGLMKSGVFTQLYQLVNNSVAQYFTSDGRQHKRPWKMTWKMTRRCQEGLEHSITYQQIDDQ